MASILLAEDSPTHTALIRSLLEDDAHRVHCVGDGRQALEAIEESCPDLVVTDLRMPNVNGQELVQELAESFPTLPSVVVTARGSESLAVDALALGAANFVPKNSLQKLLTHVVRQTLGMAEVNAIFQQFTGFMYRPEFSMTLENHVPAIEPAVLYLEQTLAAATSLKTVERIRVGTALASALFNAMCYGNLELKDEDTFVSRMLSGDESGGAELKNRADEPPYCNRRVELKVSVGDKDTRLLIAHDGPGRMTRMTPAPGTPESFELEQCRGLMLMTSFMDDVMFQSDYSNVVMVKKHRPLDASK
ncbi:MAG: response regulator [Rubripirellula sp.]